MANKSRSPLQVSPEFKKKLDEIQRKIMMNIGERKSLREITQQIIKSPSFNEIEREIVRSGNINMDIKIRLDGRALK